MAKKLTSAQQAANAIKWIDRLTRYKKTTGTLERDGKYCCLGVACKTLGVPYEVGETWKPDLSEVLGMYDDEGEFYLKGEKTRVDGQQCLTMVNDGPHAKDRGFSGMRKFILANSKFIFKPRVHKLIKEHYAK